MDAGATEPLPRTMRALVKETAAPGAALREVAVPDPGPGELLVRVLAASVCGTDVHIERWDPWAQENFGPPPMVFGHEMAGVVVGHGPGAGRVRLGELVAAETNAWVSEGLAQEVAALQEPMGNAVHAAFVEEIAGQSVAVLGCGPIGLMAVAIARLAGARHVFATDINPERLAIATAMGADEVIDAREDVAARLRAHTGGDGVDVVLEMSGAESALHQGLAALTNGGRISLLGTHARPATLDLSEEVIFKGIRVYGITGRRMFETWYRTTALLEEGLDITPIITHRMPLADYQRAFDLVAAGHAGKVVLLPQDG